MTAVTEVLTPEGAVPTLDDWAISEIVGELNTEAKCIALLSVPVGEGATPISSIRENLAVRGAFQFVDRSRFNVLGIYKEMRSGLVALHHDPYANNGIGTYWVGRPDSPLTTFSNAWAGSFLDYSAGLGLASENPDENIGLRDILGERKQPPNPTSATAIEARLAALALLVAVDDEAAGNVFRRHAVIEPLVEKYGISKGPAREHLNHLQEIGLLTSPCHGSPKIELATLSDGREARTIIRDFLKIVAGFARGSNIFEQNGLQSAEQIMSDPEKVAALVRKSYERSPHTGKHTPHARPRATDLSE